MSSASLTGFLSGAKSYSALPMISAARFSALADCDPKQIVNITEIAAKILLRSFEFALKNDQKTLNFEQICKMEMLKIIQAHAAAKSKLTIFSKYRLIINDLCMANSNFT